MGSIVFCVESFRSFKSHKQGRAKEKLKKNLKFTRKSNFKMLAFYGGPRRCYG